MKSLKEELLLEVEGVFHNIVKDKSENGILDDDSRNAVNEITDLLFEEGFIQHKAMDIYKKYSIESEVHVLRLNKYIEKLYIENQSRIREALDKELKDSIPQNPMNLWLAELIEEDLCSGVAPFENTTRNIKRIHDIAINYDPLFDSINNGMLDLYHHIEKHNLINPIEIVDKGANNEYTDTPFDDIVDGESSVEYVESPFGNII